MIIILIRAIQVLIFVVSSEKDPCLTAMPSSLMNIHCVQMSKYGVISDPYFPVFGLATGKYEPEITPYLDTFHAVIRLQFDLLRCVLAVKTT